MVVEKTIDKELVQCVRRWDDEDVPWVTVSAVLLN